MARPAVTSRGGLPDRRSRHLDRGLARLRQLLLGIVYYWGSSHQGLPVSFFIVAVVFVTYLASGIRISRSARADELAPTPSKVGV